MHGAQKKIQGNLCFFFLFINLSIERYKVNNFVSSFYGWTVFLNITADHIASFSDKHNIIAFRKTCAKITPIFFLDLFLFFI